METRTLLMDPLETSTALEVVCSSAYVTNLGLSQVEMFAYNVQSPIKIHSKSELFQDRDVHDHEL